MNQNKLMFVSFVNAIKEWNKIKYLIKKAIHFSLYTPKLFNIILNKIILFLFYLGFQYSAFKTFLNTI